MLLDRVPLDSGVMAIRPASLRDQVLKYKLLGDGVVYFEGKKEKGP
jgi:hypothetical protein